jgi:hypothetical protein
MSASLCALPGLWRTDLPGRPVLPSLAQANSDYCPQCNSAGGEGLAAGCAHWPALQASPASAAHAPALALAVGPAVVSNGTDFWPNGRNGICGDPWSMESPRNHEIGGKYYSASVLGGAPARRLLCAATGTRQRAAPAAPRRTRHRPWAAPTCSSAPPPRLLLAVQARTWRAL